MNESFPQSRYYSIVLKDQAEKLRHLHFDVAPAYASIDTVFSQPAPDTSLKTDDPACVDAYQATRAAYGFSDLQDTFIRKRLPLSNPYYAHVIYNDRVFNTLNGFMTHWDDDHNAYDFAESKTTSAMMCNFTLNEITPVDPSISSVKHDGQKYYETGYRNMVTGVVGLAMCRRLVESDRVAGSADDKAPLIEHLQQQEQLVLNCTNLFYLFYENYAAERGIAIESKTKPEFALAYPAKVPGNHFND